MLKVEYLGWAAYAPGGMPDDVKSVVAKSPTKVTITLTGPTNPYWFTYNELSQITPFPMAWDISASRSEGRERGVRHRVLRRGDRDDGQEELQGHAGLGGREVVRQPSTRISRGSPASTRRIPRRRTTR